MKKYKSRTPSEWSSIWNKSYSKNENLLLYPHEEVIRFTNKYINKRIDISRFENSFSEKPKIIDFGCGAGRHVLYFAQNHLYPIGIDISDVALEKAHELLSYNKISKNEYELRSVIDFEENIHKDSIDYAIAHGSLDSMPTSDAITYSNDIFNLLKNHGLFFVEVINNYFIPKSQKEVGDLEFLVQDEFENNTIQNYYDEKKILKVFEKFKIVHSKIIKYQNTNLGYDTSFDNIALNILILKKEI